MLADELLLLLIGTGKLLAEAGTHHPTEVAIERFQCRFRITLQFAVVDAIVLLRVNLFTKRKQVLKPGYGKAGVSL